MLNYVLSLFSLKVFQQSNEVIWLNNFHFTTNILEMLAFSPDTELGRKWDRWNFLWNGNDFFQPAV